MNLHRTAKQPEWESTSPAEHSFFQRVAAKTNGIVTPGNGVTVIGFGLVLYGLGMILADDIIAGSVLIVVGRLLDIADGLLAEATRTKSPLGELFDAAADKLGTVLTLIVLIVSGIASPWIIAALAIPQVIILAIVFYKRQKGIGIQPTRFGKLSMALVWVAIAGVCLIEGFGSTFWLVALVYSSVITSAVLGVGAIWQYATGRG